MNILKGLTLIDYCNENAVVCGGQATTFFSEIPVQAADTEVAPGIIVRSQHYELPPVRPNTVYIVPLHVFLDLETKEGRIDYITPVGETRGGNNVIYTKFRVSCKKQDFITIATSGSHYEEIITSIGGYYKDITGQLQAVAEFNNIVKPCMEFYRLFLREL